jgi:outer membrane protein assembly factor BamB
MTRIVTLEGKTGKIRKLQPLGFHPSVTPIDVDGDGKLEILQHCDGGGPIVCVDAETLETKWRSAKPVRVHAAFGDLDGDGCPEVVVHEGGLYALSGRDGSLLWEYPVATGASDCCLCDIDGDGVLEALVASGSKIMAIRLGGASPTLAWEFDAGTPCGAPIAADVDGDGRSEVLFAGADGYLRVIGQ